MSHAHSIFNAQTFRQLVYTLLELILKRKRNYANKTTDFEFLEKNI